MDTDHFEAMIAGLESQGLTKGEIARSAGVSYATIWRVANGVGSSHLVTTIDRIDGLLKRSMNSTKDYSRVNKKSV